jgi:hypothetical protein
MPPLKNIIFAKVPRENDPPGKEGLIYKIIT